MNNDHSTDDLISFLQHASERGLMPAASAQALAVASRNVFAVLNDVEKSDVRVLNLDDTIKRFTNKRAKEFNPASLKEYVRRVHRAVELFLTWRSDPASFSVKTRTTALTKTTAKPSRVEVTAPVTKGSDDDSHITSVNAHTPGSGYQTSFPIRAGQLITLSNIPQDLTKQEAERLAAFIGMLAIG